MKPKQNDKLAVAVIEFLDALLARLFQFLEFLCGTGGGGSTSIPRGFSQLRDLQTGTIYKGNITEMELKEGQKVKATVGGFKTAAGHTANIEAGSGAWSSSDETVVRVTPNPDNQLEATFETMDGSENASVTVEFRADGRPGEGVKEIIVAGTIVATQGDASVGELTFGTPEDAAV